MKTRIFSLAVLMSLTFLCQMARAQWSTPPASGETEKLYTDAIEKRAADIITAIGVTDADKCLKLHDAIIAQYRTLRARDEAIDGLLRIVGKDVNYSNRFVLLEAECKPVHEKFIAKLSTILTAGQVEKVKDTMTYNKVKVTYDAYCQIVPGLTDAEKAKILEELKSAREEAIDGGSHTEKSEIFQKYKDQINAYLTANGHDVTKAFKDWEARQPQKTASAKPADTAK